MTCSMLRIAAVCLVTAFAGCASSYPPFTESLRTTTDLKSTRFYVGTTVEFRSVRQLDKVDEQGPFRQDGRRYLRIEKADPGRAVAQGEDWIAVDFGKGIVLTFTRTSPSGAYRTRGWGTYTIEGERYDMMVGVLSGSDIPLLFDPKGSGETDASPPPSGAARLSRGAFEHGAVHIGRLPCDMLPEV